MLKIIQTMTAALAILAITGISPVTAWDSLKMMFSGSNTEIAELATIATVSNEMTQEERAERVFSLANSVASTIINPTTTTSFYNIVAKTYNAADSYLAANR